MKSSQNGDLMKVKTIKQKWEEFEAECINVDAPQIQHDEMRVAFYAGFSSMLAVGERIGMDDISEDEGVKILQTLLEEVLEFTMGLPGVGHG